MVTAAGHIWAQPSPHYGAGRKGDLVFSGIKQWLPQKLRILEMLKIRLHSTGPALGYGETLGTKCKGTQKLSKQARSFSIQYFWKSKLMQKSL